MRIYFRKCQCRLPAVALPTPPASGVVCECGVQLEEREIDMPAPSHPVNRLSFPTVDRFVAGGIGRLDLYRKTIGARTVGGQTEILCRYGEDIEKWYPVAA